MKSQGRSLPRAGVTYAVTLQAADKNMSLPCSNLGFSWGISSISVRNLLALCSPFFKRSSQ